jgi:ABC-type Mn2+/Zn2+ transport system permease subunit
LTGGCGFIAGLLLAVRLDLPAGPAVVVTLVTLALGLRLWQSVVD